VLIERERFHDGYVVPPKGVAVTALVCKPTVRGD
jgi:hypothetical protein